MSGAGNCIVSGKSQIEIIQRPIKTIKFKRLLKTLNRIFRDKLQN